MAGSSSRTLVILALVANGIIAVMKFIAAAITAAMPAEGFLSTADTGNQLFLLRGAANLKIEFEDGLTGGQIESTIDDVETAVRQVVPSAVFVEPESVR